MTAADRQRGAIVVGHAITALTVARALAAGGVHVVLLQARDKDFAHRSRAVAETIQIGDLRAHPGSLADRLEHLRDRLSGWAVVPTGDLEMVTLLDSRELLERWYRLVVPPLATGLKLLHKDRTYEEARATGIHVPRDYGEALRETADNSAIEYPVVVKPVESHVFRDRVGGKLLPANDRAELLRHIETTREHSIPARVLDLVPGPDSQFFNYSVYIDARGEPVGGFAMRKLRKSPPFFGVCRVAVTDVAPARAATLRESTVELLRRVGYRGMANAEYKLDPRDGRLRLMEINGRCFMMLGLPLRAGMNYPLMAWEDFVLGQRPRATPNGWRGAWIHFHADVQNTIKYRRREGLGLRSYVAPYLGRKTFAVWSLRDPAPFLGQTGSKLRRLAGGVRSGSLRRKAVRRAESSAPAPPAGRSGRDDPGVRE